MDDKDDLPLVDTRKALEIGRRLEAERLIRLAADGLALLGLPYVRLAKQFRAVATLVAEGKIPRDLDSMKSEPSPETSNSS